MVQAPCPCCIPAMFLLAIAAIGIILKLVDSLILSFFPKWKVAKKVYLILSRSFTALVGLLAISLGYVSQSPDWKEYLFFKFALMMGEQAFRCEHLKSVSGRVLELGPGPGTNFKCWENNDKITEWVGVEPNKYFQQHLLQQTNVKFPIKVINIKGENLDIEPESFDSVVGTHVLCSVDDILLVLKQVNRALKSTGIYYFMEHVSAPENTLMYYGQRMFEPFINIIGNGCLFKPTWLYLTQDSGLPNYDITLKHFDAPMPLPVLIPHIIGVAVKK